MKKILSLFILIFTTITSAGADSLSFPFTQDNVKDWKFFSDQVMGGISEGQVSLEQDVDKVFIRLYGDCLLYTSPSPRDGLLCRMPSSA